MKRDYNFMDEWREGRATADSVNDWVSNWHSEHDITCSLRRYLGMTEAQYKRWVETAEILDEWR